MIDTEVLGQLRSVVSKGSVSSDSEGLDRFRPSNAIIDSIRQPRCVIRPADKRELQGVIRLANARGLNLTVASSGGDHCKCGFAAQNDNILIDLSGWKSIEWINRRNRVCMIEPGVTYGELLDALEPHGMTISMPLAPRRQKSVIASVMDREPSTWPNKQWDAGDPAASTEFIFGNGEMFRTGAGGGPGTLEQQRAVGGAQKFSAGPSQTDFCRIIQGSQGTMGIVTWITMRTELKPSVQKPFLLGSNSLEKLVPFVYEVQRPWLGEHSLILNNVCAAMLISSRRDADFEDLRGSLPHYICLQNIAGFERMPRERVDYQMKDIGHIAQRCGLSLTREIGPISADRLLETATSPTEDGDWRRAHKGRCLSFFFLSTLNRVEDLLGRFIESAGKINLNEESIGIYIQPVVQNHACHVELMVPFTDNNTDEIDNLNDFEKEIVRKLAREGAFFSRPYGSSQEIVFKQNPLNHEILRKVKEIFDPNRVLNRGKWDL